MSIQKHIAVNEVHAAKVIGVSRIENTIHLAIGGTQTNYICTAQLEDGFLVYMPCRSVRAGCRQLGQVLDVLIIKVDESETLAVGFANEISC